MHEPLHPGAIVEDALLNGTGISSINEAALLLQIDRTTLSRLINGHTSLSRQMAKRLALFLGTTVEHWLNIQKDYDVWLASQEPDFKIKPLKSLKLVG